MLFSNNVRHFYQRSPLVEVICQLRFPAILSIESDVPAQFQEAIRGDFPQYVTKKDQRPPKLINPGTPQAKLEPQSPVTNHHFVSADGVWKVNMTQDFISLSTLRYVRWEDFAQKLDKVLASFIQIYQPAHFERIGLRYVNAISRSRLGLQDMLWDDLIETPFIGVLDQPDVDETLVNKCSMDVEMGLGDNKRMKLHAGPGRINAKAPEPVFILDSDFSAAGKNIPANQIAADLNVLHDYAVRLFNAATTQELKDAMGAVPLN